MVRRQPLVVGVVDLGRRPGTRRSLDILAPLTDVSTSTARVPPSRDLQLEGTLESIEGARFALSATALVPWEGECRRCLEPVRGTLEIELSEIFEKTPADDDTYQVEGDELDLEPVLHDAALLALPLAPLCREDCPGPAPDAFPTGPAGEGDAPAEPDPRWAALRELDLDE